MRLALAQLRKHSMPYSYDEEMDLRNELVGFEDIVNCSLIKIHGIVNELGPDFYEIKMDIEATLVMESAISLKNVSVSIATSACELYAKEEVNDEIFLIEKETIDTKEAVLTNILVNKPMTVVAPGESFDSDDSEEETNERVSPFAALKDLL